MYFGPDTFFAKWIYDTENVENPSPQLATLWLTFGFWPLIPLRRSVVLPDVVTLTPSDPWRAYYEKKLVVGYHQLERRSLSIQEIAFTICCRWGFGFFALLFDLFSITFVLIGGIAAFVYAPKFLSEMPPVIFVVDAGVFGCWCYCLFNHEKLLHSGFRWIEQYESRRLRRFAEEDREP